MNYNSIKNLFNKYENTIMFLIIVVVGVIMFKITDIVMINVAKDCTEETCKYLLTKL